MQKTQRITKFGLAAILALATSACAPIVRNHGFAPSDAELEEVIVGVDTRETVEDTVGPPSVSGVMRADAWYYVASSWETRGAFAPKETDRQVVAVSFDEAGTVQNIERYGLEDGRVVALNRRVSDDNIKGISFIRQLLGNIGNFTADQFVDN
ncbi:outer membrane protein assembly factor BamE [Actibacterium lipolyticum]|uniref:SmpA / OmlA family protein n=1 Tax=Actibacterium lipolyticum TaxID=1524263 RepID=A0A238KGN8_9RHOB|nr:outer membrane protein assembly factor BamE [Actibacterium lipolyticum]SMX41734.1 SmpA / OmlA family protein [Actibacterium lipolyticum]